ncbi:MAG: ABC transporter ATP-binding protein/permease [Clostridia bacterium]|nr:ABC transporter ATP-binding protein/permease [Clostridia bacterium]
MKILWEMGKSAAKYRLFYVISILSTFAITAVNLTTPKILSAMTAIVQNGITREGLHEIGGFTITLTILFLLRVGFRFMSSYFSHTAAWRLVEDLRVRVYDKVQSLSMSYFHDMQTGDLMSRVMNDTAHFEQLYAHIIPDLITNLLTFAGVLVMLLTINARLALFTCLPIPFVFVGGLIFSKKIRPAFQKTQKTVAEVNAKLQDNFSGIHEIQAFNQEEKETKIMNGMLSVFTKTMLRALKMSAVFHPTIEFLSSAGFIILVGFGGILAFQGTLDTSEIVAFLLYISMFYGPVTALAQMLEQVQQAFAGAERVAQVLEEERQIKDAPGAADLRDVKGAIEFDHVSFHYQDNVPVLTDVSVLCEPGQMVALVGPTGVGKTTFSQLIPRFYDPIAGTIRIDGQDIRQVTVASLRRCIAPVLQDTFLFNGTIAENIAYSLPGADRQAIQQAAEAAFIHQEIMAMPQGYDTRIGERGVKLSGGQKQRIAIARARLRNAPIIILDEATASVDTGTEKEIQKAIKELAKTRTVVAIAHRLSTIRSADIILVIDGGAIAERGTHARLMAQGGIYKKLYDMQARSEGKTDG